jgi:hypothetical protein
VRVINSQFYLESLLEKEIFIVTGGAGGRYCECVKDAVIVSEHAIIVGG